MTGNSVAHVLIVEDHEENRNLLKMLLQANGYRVTGAGDGLEALAAARSDRPDVVVSDGLMPNMDGDVVGLETGWELRVAPELTRIAPPTSEEVALLRRLDPYQFYLSPGRY